MRQRLGLGSFRPTTEKKPAPKPRPAPNDDADAKRVLALSIWGNAVSVQGTIAATYLAARGLDLDQIPEPDEIVRYHPRCPWGGERVTCMVTLFRHIHTDEPVAIHRTRLDPTGKKIERKMLGSVAGVAMKVDADADTISGLTIGEGFETCLAARQMGFRPAWALGSAGAIGTFPALAGIDALTILAEHDDSGANARAIDTCAHQWLEAGREVVVVDPLLAGDANDVLQERRRHA